MRVDRVERHAERRRGDEADPVGRGDDPGDAALVGERHGERRAAGEAGAGQAEADRGQGEADGDAVEVARQHGPDEPGGGDHRAPQDQRARRRRRAAGSAPIARPAWPTRRPS